MQSKSNIVIGRILGYKRGSGRQYNNKVLIKVFIDSKNIHKLIGSKVIAKDSKDNTYNGKIVKIHSTKNTVAIAHFKPNIPGQLIGSTVSIILLK